MLDADVRLDIGALSMRARVSFEPGELVALVGPNGAGKTTFLRAIAGLQPISGGRILLDGSVLDDGGRSFVPPQERRVGFVPQDDRLLPHLDTLGNVAFGPRCSGMRRAGAEALAAELLKVVGLAACARSKPTELSGGQAKRAALARALAVRPRVLLMDEPFAGLDATALGQMRRELKSYLKGHDGVRVLVTHEPVEALALADRIVVMEHGRIVQDGGPDEISSRPRSAYVADLVGVNLYRGTLTPEGLRTAGVDIVAAAPSKTAGDGFATIHPRSVALHIDRPEGSPRNVWRGLLTSIDAEGETLRVRVEGDLVIVAEITRSALASMGLSPGTKVFASVKAAEVSVFG